MNLLNSNTKNRKKVIERAIKHITLKGFNNIVDKMLVTKNRQADIKGNRSFLDQPSS